MSDYSVSGGRLLADGRAVEMIPSRFTTDVPDRVVDLLVMHFTYGASGRSSAEWFRDPSNPGSSAHVVVDRDGSIIQCVSTEVAAWHAGKSSWRGRTDTNRRSIGIELANWGYLERHGAGWASYTGVPIADPVIATHKNGNPDGGRAPIGWEPYYEAQFNAAVAIARALVATYGITEIVGHDDVAPSRKWDPGPAFDMERFRREVFAGAVGDEAAPSAAPADHSGRVTTVEDVQGALNALGYGPIAVDGDIGDESRAAVERFQADAGLDVDGDPGPKTRAALAVALRRRDGGA